MIYIKLILCCLILIFLTKLGFWLWERGRVQYERWDFGRGLCPDCSRVSVSQRVCKPLSLVRTKTQTQKARALPAALVDADWLLIPEAVPACGMPVIRTVSYTIKATGHGICD